MELLGFDSENLDQKLKSVLKEIHAEKVEHVNKSLNSALNINGTSSSVFDQIQANNDLDDDTFNDIARSMSPVNLSFKNGN